MPVTKSYQWTELIESRSLTWTEQGQQAIRVYKIYGTDDPELAINSLGAPDLRDSHPTLPALYVSNIRIDPWPDLPNHCKATITYSNPPLALGIYEERWEFDQTSQQEHITSVKDSSYCLHYPSDNNVGTAIGVDGDDVKGVDVYRQSPSIKVTKLFDSLSPYYRYVLERLTHTVNNWTWFGYQAGEALFLGTRITKTDTGRIQVEYYFMTSRYLGAFPIELLDGSVLTAAVLPFDYLWFRHGEKPVTKDDGSQIRAKGIESVHLAQVYEYANFWYLGLVGPN